MEESGASRGGKTGRLSAWVSRLYLALVLVLTVLTIKTVCPGAAQTARSWLGLEPGGRTAAAFSALRDALADGDGVAAAFAESYLALAGETP